MKSLIAFLAFLLLMPHQVEPVKPLPTIQQPREIVATVTYYTASQEECGKTDGITASGTIATEGRTIAMDSSIPFGTRVIIDGHEYIVEDRGGAIVGNRVDIFTNSREYALNMGRTHKLIQIIE